MHVCPNKRNREQKDVHFQNLKEKKNKIIYFFTLIEL